MPTDLSYIIEPLRTLAVPIGDLVPDPENARKHGAKNLAALRSSLTTHGQYLPLVASEGDMVVRVGNGRLQVAKALGWTHVAVVVAPMDRVAALSLALADNRTSELAEWDFGVLANVLQELKTTDLDLEDLGWTPPELEPLLGGDDDWAPEEVDATIPEPVADKPDKVLQDPTASRVVVFTLEQWERLDLGDMPMDKVAEYIVSELIQ